MLTKSQNKLGYLSSFDEECPLHETSLKSSHGCAEKPDVMGKGVQDPHPKPLLPTQTTTLPIKEDPW